MECRNIYPRGTWSFFRFSHCLTCFVNMTPNNLWWIFDVKLASSSSYVSSCRWRPGVGWKQVKVGQRFLLDLDSIVPFHLEID